MEHLIGIWLYTSLIYRGTPIPPLDENLQMYFIFNNENENQLFYYRTSAEGQCRRTATYSYRDNKLYQKIVSADASNAANCSEDPDMQPGRETVSDLEVTENCMYLTLPLGDETLTYVWQKTGAPEAGCNPAPYD